MSRCFLIYILKDSEDLEPTLFKKTKDREKAQKCVGRLTREGHCVKVTQNDNLFRGIEFPISVYESKGGAILFKKHDQEDLGEKIQMEKGTLTKIA